MHSNNTDKLNKKLQQELADLKKELAFLKNEKSKTFSNSNLLIDNTVIANSIFENAGIGMAIIDRNFKLVKYNQSFNALFGYSHEELLNMTYLNFIPEDKKGRANQLFENMFSSKLDKYTTEEAYFKKDKSVVWLKLNASVIRNEKGEPEYILGIGEDITVRVENEKRLKEAKNKAEESDKLKTAFLTNMSHEIRTPMNAIIGFSELMTDPNSDKESQKEFTEQIYNSSIMLLKLIDDIIDISQLDSGNLKIKESSFNLSDLFTDLLTKFEKEKEKEGKKDIELLIHNPFGDSNIHLLSDSYRFFQIFSNLINNALKYTIKGFIEFGFNINSNDEVVFYVRDTGIGIPEDKTEAIFDHFTKIQDKKILYRGTGIGLTITKKLINLLGGEIWVQSNLGIGSIFYFKVPGKIIIEKSNTEDIRKNYNWIGKKILVAEDDDTNFAVIKASLKHSNVEIDRVLTGDNAVKKCLNKKYDAVLMDLRMPILGGIEATKEIRKFDSNVPIIAQTAFNQNNEKETCLMAGCNEYLLKPTNSNILLETLKKFMTTEK